MRGERTGRMGQETVNCGMDRWTGMHRPWGDFCVYRSALTREPRAAACKQARRGNEGSPPCFFVFFFFPSSPSLARRAALRAILFVQSTWPVKVQTELSLELRKQLSQPPLEAAIVIPFPGEVRFASPSLPEPSYSQWLFFLRRDERRSSDEIRTC